MFESSKARDLEVMMDKVSTKFGADKIMRARDMKDQGTVAKNGVNLDYLDYRDGERVSAPGSS